MNEKANIRWGVFLVIILLLFVIGTLGSIYSNNYSYENEYYNDLYEQQSKELQKSILRQELNDPYEKSQQELYEEEYYRNLENKIDYNKLRYDLLRRDQLRDTYIDSFYDNQYDNVETYKSKFICEYNAYDCADFSSRVEAQTCFRECGGITNDVHHLDGDGDGLACEWL